MWNEPEILDFLSTGSFILGIQSTNAMLEFWLQIPKNFSNLNVSSLHMKDLENM
jgi:hypothetical protein